MHTKSFRADKNRENSARRKKEINTERKRIKTEARIKVTIASTGNVNKFTLASNFDSGSKGERKSRLT